MMRNRDHIGTGYRLRCDWCQRAPEFTLDRWAQLVTGLDAAAVETFDIAALPF